MSFLLEGITAVTWQQAVMYVVGIILIWLAVKKEYEPSLLLPLGFGAILVNLPYSGVVDQMVQGKIPAAGIIEWLFKTGIEASEAFTYTKLLNEMTTQQYDLDEKVKEYYFVNSNVITSNTSKC